MPHTTGTTYRSRPGHKRPADAGGRRPAPTRSNAGGSVRGQARARQVQALNAAKRGARVKNPAAAQASTRAVAAARAANIARYNQQFARPGQPALPQRRATNAGQGFILGLQSTIGRQAGEALRNPRGTPRARRAR